MLQYKFSLRQFQLKNEVFLVLRVMRITYTEAWFDFRIVTGFP